MDIDIKKYFLEINEIRVKMSENSMMTSVKITNTSLHIVTTGIIMYYLNK
ncbi:hypothetical protein O3G_MSEX014350 [Manduca sexta]|uniref:Uncharacterized protein n=1 Tax=Manduca sexta TaxID=7130 RepID=A0A921ZVH0_MANSE|nr:hypothetical protein O3G_MSEX014350 [Manduca sexta]KAG6464202.1 hypothetical protein O3G_MSEX014350 [Manduca sexta]